MSNPRTAVIIGAGIGGLAAGLSLRRAGWNVRIHERAATPRELGFGLALAPNALSALQELGVAEPVVRAGARLAKIEFRLLNGRVLRQISLPIGFPSVVALRPELHGALLRAVDDAALTLGSEAASLHIDGSGFIVRFKDGATETADMLIGADGIRSVVRQCLHPDEPAPRPSGYCAVRGVAYDVGHHLGDVSGVGYFGDALEAATIRASSEAVYWYMSLRAQDVREETPRAILDQRSAGFAPALRAILSATRPEDMRFDHLFERDPLPSWGSGRVTLLGDAAHPVLPHTGQGAAQALEDAVALGLCVGHTPDIETALRRYEAVRMRRTRPFIKMGPRIARTTTTDSVAIRTLRSLVIQWAPASLLALSARRFQRDPHRELRSGVV